MTRHQAGGGGGPGKAILALVCIFISCSAAEDFSHGWVIVNAWLLGAGIAVVFASVVVEDIRRPHVIRRALEKARAETAREFAGVIVQVDDYVGTTTARVVARGLTIRCPDEEIVRVTLPLEVSWSGFDVDRQVIKRAGERWPVVINPARPGRSLP
jgi:hypothetical protein